MPTDLVDLNEHLIITWNLVSRFMAAELPRRRGEDGLTLIQLRVLWRLRGGALTMTETAHMEGVTRASATGLVERLASRGLVERFTDPSNRRQVRVKLTAKGDALRGQVHEETLRRVHQLTGSMTETELEELRRSLASLRRLAYGEGNGALIRDSGIRG